MYYNLILSTLFLIAVGGAAYFLWWPLIYKRRIVSKPFPDQWHAILNQQLPIYGKLPSELRQQLQNRIKYFIASKQFIGCAGLEIEDQIKITIAAQACLLLLNRPTHEYADLRYIYVYPTSFRAIHEVRNEIGLVSKQTRDLLGESWNTGKVVLAWDNVEQGVRNFHDGYNVVLHEFAHQLDQESGAANGAPLLYTKAAYKSWAYVFGREFEKLQRQAPGSPSIIDHYGATNPAEFFAVATETFFEEPIKLYKHHRELFEQLQAYYRLDPRAWV